MEPYNSNLLKQNTSYQILDPSKIKSLPTKTLLKVYKTLHSYTTYGGYCECGCGESYISLNGSAEEKEIQSKLNSEVLSYKKFLKEELNTREHIPKKKTSKPNPKREYVLLKKKIRDQNLYLLTKDQLKAQYNSGEFQTSGRYRFLKENKFSFKEIVRICELIKHSRLNS